MNLFAKLGAVLLAFVAFMIPAVAQTSYQPFSITASTTLDSRHVGAALVVNAAAGLTLTLPNASGSGVTYEIVIGTTVTSNNVVIQVANADDVMTGVAIIGQDAADTAVLFETASTSDTLTLNGSTKGGIKGDRILLKDVGNDLWLVQMIGSGTGTEATPFSAAVS
jgi:hypothetical protein